MNKKVANSKTRIMALMDYYHISQTELCQKTGLQKSALSNYLNGTREPRQNQISLIADPFDINPAWLMGYDVPMFIRKKESSDNAVDALLIREVYKHFTDEQLNDPVLSKQIGQFMEFLKNLDPAGREALLNFARTLKF